MSAVFNRRTAAATIMLCGLFAMVLALSATRSSDAASVLDSDVDLRILQDQHPTLNLSSAKQLMSDAHGTVWVSHATDGQVCLIEKPIGDPVRTTSRFSCRDGDVAAVEGIVAGVPGDWYGYAPVGVPSAEVISSGRSVGVAVGANQGFRLPDNASGVTVNGKYYELPTKLDAK